MAGVVYTSRLLANGSFTGTISYTVPAGHRAVVRHADVINTPAEAATVYLSVNGIAIGVYAFAAGSIVNRTWDGTAVAYAGEAITVYTTAPVSAQVSGYLFSDP